MRNLKRALSLALAAIMLLGMMVVGAGAVNLDEFSDKEDIANKDAVSLLTTLGIINGKEDGSFFDPNGNVTRAEMAKMISVILNKGTDNNDLYVGAASSLTDVKGHWAEGHINYCSSLGIIAGRGDGTFDPGATVTASEAAKMLLVAVGYNAEIERFVGGDWAVNVNAKASALGIFNGFTKNVTAPLNRDDAALLIYNALDVERIQQYSGNYALVYSDRRTILGEVYGVYKLKGVVTGNKWAQLDDTDYDDRLADGKTRMENIEIFASNTQGTNTGSSGNGANNNNTIINLGDTEIFNVDTPVEYLGQTVTMYVRKTTVLNDYEVMGVQLREEDNTVVKTAEIIDFKPADNTLKTLLKGTGLTVKTSGDDVPEYYVNYGVVANEAAANDVLKLDTAKVTEGAQITSNKYGVELTVIDNNRDGNVDYVLWLQEDLTQITGVSSARKTVTFLAEQDKDITSYNGGRAIDEDDIVFVDEAKEGDIVLVRTYGGRYYVSQPEVVTGKMDSYSADKTKEQYIVVDGETYHASYINTTAGNEVDNIYTFDIKKCAEKNNDAAVQWDITYDYYLDSNGHIAAFKPSEKLVPNYALIVESGYNPGVYASDASGKITVVLADGTEATYPLNFSASASNLRAELKAYNNAAYGEHSKEDGIAELKGFLGTDYTDNSATRPWNAAYASGYEFAGEGAIADGQANGPADGDPKTDYPAGKAAGYVITYTLNSDDVLTIQSVVGTFDSTKPGADLGAYVVGQLTTKYEKGDAKIIHDDHETNVNNYKNGNGKYETAIDKDTIAFYYNVTAGKANYGVVIGYDNMKNVNADKKFLATNVGAKYRDGAYVATAGTTFSGGTNLAEMVLFNEDAPESSKDYVYIMGRNTHYESGKYVTLYGIGVDGKNMELKVERDNWEDLFRDNDDSYNCVYEFSTNSSGVTDLDPTDTQVIVGYAIKLQNGTVAFNDYNSPGLPGQGGTDTLPTNTVYEDSYALAKEDQVWNVTDLANTDDAPKGTFSLTKAKHAILVLDKVRETATKINAAFVWDILPEEENAGLGANVTGGSGSMNGNVYEVTVAANGTVTLTAAASGAAGTPSYAWYKSNASSAKIDKVGSAATLTVNGADLTAGDNYFLVEVTDRSDDVARQLVKVTVGAAVSGRKLTHSANNVYNIFVGNATTKSDWTAARTGFQVEIPNDATTVAIQDTTNFTADTYVLSATTGNIYKVDNDKCITVPLADFSFDNDANSAAVGNFSVVHKVHLANGIKIADHADVLAATKYAGAEDDPDYVFVKDGSQNAKLNLGTEAAGAIVVTNEATIKATTMIANGTTAIETTTSQGVKAECWVKGAAKVTKAVASANKIDTIKADDEATTAVDSNDYVAIGVTLTVTSDTTNIQAGEKLKKDVGGAGAVDMSDAFATTAVTGTHTMTKDNVEFSAG